MDETQTNEVDQIEPTEKVVPVLDPNDAFMAELDKRFQGFQGRLDRRDSEFEAKLEALKTAELSPEEQEQYQTSKSKEKVARLERENELLRMRRQYPEEVDLLEDFFKKSSMEDQLILLSTFRKVAATAEALEVEAEEQPTPVDKNNPSRRPQISLADMQGQMNNDLADKVLSSAGERGLFARLRRG